MIIVELEDSKIDLDSRELHVSKQSMDFTKDMNRKMFIENRIQCLQDKLKSNQLQQSQQQETLFQEDLSSFSNKNIKQSLFDNTWNGKPISHYQLNEKESSCNYNKFLYEMNQSQQLKSLEINQNEIEKRISMKPELLKEDEDIQIENKQTLSQILGEINEEQYIERDVYNQSNLHKSSNNEDNEEEQYDYINEQEYERMMLEIEGRETKGRISSNFQENYQLFKPSFHEEILKKDNQGKNIASFQKRNESKNEQEIKNSKIQNNTVDNVVFYPQNYSTFNQHINEEERESSFLTDKQKKDQYSNEVYNISSSAFKQKTNSQLFNSNRSDSIQDAQNDNTFQTTFFQNSFQQNQQSQLNVSGIDKKNANVSLQQNLFHDESDQQMKQILEQNKNIFENERYSYSNLIGLNRSNKKERQRYEDQENTVVNNDEQPYCSYFVHEPANNQIYTQQNENQKEQNEYQPTQFTQFFLGNAGNTSKIEQIENKGSVISQNQSHSLRNNAPYNQPVQNVNQPQSACSSQLSYLQDQKSQQLVQNYLRSPLQTITTGYINQTNENHTSYEYKSVFKPHILEQSLSEQNERDQQFRYVKTETSQENKDKFLDKNNITFNQNHEINSSIFNSFSQNIVGGCKTHHNYFNDISERRQNIYDNKEIETNRNASINGQERLNERSSSQIIESILSQNSQKIQHITNNNIKNGFYQNQQLHHFSQRTNNSSQQTNSPFQNHSFNDQLNYKSPSSIQQTQQQNKQCQQQKQTLNYQKEQKNKQPIQFNLKLENNQNQIQSEKQQSKKQNQEQKGYSPQYISKQCQNIEKQQQTINQSKQSSFHSNIFTKNTHETPQNQKCVDIKKQSQSHSPSCHFKQKNIQERLILKSKEKDIQKQERQKQSYLLANEKMKKHKTSTKSKELLQKTDQNGSIYERNQRFLKIKEQKQLQLKEEQVKQEIQYSFSPHIRPQSQNLVRNINDLIAWKENLNQKNIEMRNQQINDELKEIEEFQNEKLICKGSERILQNSSRVRVQQKVEEKLINTGLKYQQHREELEKLYNRNTNKNMPLVNKNSFKLLLNQKKKQQLTDISNQECNIDNNSPRIYYTDRNESQNSRNGHINQNTCSSSTSTQNYTLSHTNSTQVQSLKDTYFQQSYSIRSQYHTNNHSNNFNSQQTQSAQQSKSQSFLVCNQSQKLKNKQVGEEQDIQIDQNIEKLRSVSNQKYQGIDLQNSISIQNITENQVKIKNILKNDEYTDQQNNQRQNGNEHMVIRNEFNNTYDNCIDFNSPKVQNLDKNNRNGHRYYTNESLKKSYEMRQNYIMQKSRENSKQQSNNKNRINSNSLKRNKK